MKSNVQVDRLSGGGGWRLVISGILDEDTVLVDVLPKDMAGNVRINLEGVTAINSCGIREWINMIRRLEETCQLKFEEVSVCMIHQFNMILNASGTGKVASFFAPYFCEPCDRQTEVRISTADHPDLAGKDGDPKAPEVSCTSCRKAMEFDDLPEKYFIFLETQL